MKGITTNTSSCTSKASTMEPLSSSTTSTSSSSTSSSAAGGGRAIDRHNPIITATDETRRGSGGGGPFSRSAPTTPYGAINNKTAVVTPKARHFFPNSPLITFSGVGGQKNTNKKSSKKSTNGVKSSNTNNSNNFGNKCDDEEVVVVEKKRRSFSKAKPLSDLTTTKLDRYACPPPPESSRYLLDNNNEDDYDDDTSFLDMLSSNFDNVVKMVPSYDSNKVEHGRVSEAPKQPPPPLCSSPPSSSPVDQVVVLRVSLHCRGCERKLKKHLSRMPGVKSFNVDFAAKKVTVVGDVTPLQVLASISKVKNAQMWKPPTSSSFPTYN